MIATHRVQPVGSGYKVEFGGWAADTIESELTVANMMWYDEETVLNDIVANKYVKKHKKNDALKKSQIWQKQQNKTGTTMAQPRLVDGSPVARLCIYTSI